MAMAQTACRARTVAYRAHTTTASRTKSAEMPLFQAFLRPPSPKTTDRLCIKDTTTIDLACGSGSLLLQAKKQFDAHLIEEGFFGQEINHTTYNLARMNMFLHNINYDKFDIALGNTLINPQYGDEKPFDAIVSNPPYSVNWLGSDDPTLINDDRFYGYPYLS
jgi:type I restriction-modification system, M subunit